MKSSQPESGRTAQACLAAVLVMALAGLLLFVLAPGLELGAQNERWRAEYHDRTNFPLLGKHRSVPCGECHLQGVIAGTPRDCQACHWDRRRDDRYQLRLGTNCADCHTPFDWKKLKANSWEHGQVTGFSLAGVHKTMDCSGCHPGNTFLGHAQECYSCHRRQYEQAKDPDHVAAHFPIDCRQCHFSMTNWRGGQSTHSTFPLQGLHKAAACADCHKNNVYAGTPQTCVSCHLKNYNATRNPNHKLAGYSTDCVSCHGSSAQTWNNAVVNHNQFWPLLGAHKTLDCSQCHSSTNNPPRDCYGCHRTNYENTTTPNHRQAGYSTDCVSCHGSAPLTWKNAAVNHNQFWPLLGAHKTLDCNRCHSAGYNLPRDCYGCHRTNYENTTNPNHRLAGYSTVCENCHFSSHTSWYQAVFNHKFPIRSGKHAGFACTDCHLSSNYLVFSCIDCHSHSKSDTDSKHHGVNGYSYNSQACYSCHPNGSAGDSGGSFRLRR